MDDEEIIKEFFDAIYNNNLKTIIEMITNNLVDINDIYNENGEPPLVYAVKVNKPEVLILLLTNDADINIKVKNIKAYSKYKEEYFYKEIVGFTPLVVAFEWNNIACMKVLFNYKPNILSSRYKGATFVNKWICYFAELYEMFYKSSEFKNSIDDDIKTKLKEIYMKYKFGGKLYEKDFFLSYDDLMFEAIAKNNFNLFLQLFKKKKKNNDDYLSLKTDKGDYFIPILFVAIKFENEKVIEYLMKEGFNINNVYDLSFLSTNKYLLTKKHSMTPLIFAIGSKKNDIAKYLIDNGADINKTSSYKTASNSIYVESTYSMADRTKNYEMIHLLVDMGYDISKEYKK